MHVDGIGEFTRDDRLGWLVGQPLWFNVLGKECRFVLDGYEEDLDPAAFVVAAQNFLALGPIALHASSSEIFRYYLDRNSDWSPEDDEYVSISTPHDVWSHIQVGTNVAIGRRGYGDKKVYISLECECDWEPEHGLQIVFREGSVVCKVGAYDGHFTNSDAYARPELEGVVYHGL